MLNRRDFARLSIAAAAATAIAPPQTRPNIKPKRLTAGDTVGLVLPASAAFESDEVQFGKDQMEALGFHVEIGRHAFHQYGYFSRRARDRADDINPFFAAGR